MYGLGYTTSNAGVDEEPDGLTNLQEFVNDTNPVIADPDGDGLTDGEEINTYLTNPKQKDSDLDGLTDGQEVMDLDPVAGGVQNPFDPNNADTTGDSGSNSPDTIGDGTTTTTATRSRTASSSGMARARLTLPVISCIRRKPSS